MYQNLNLGEEDLDSFRYTSYFLSNNRFVVFLNWQTLCMIWLRLFFPMKKSEKLLVLPWRENMYVYVYIYIHNDSPNSPRSPRTIAAVALLSQWRLCRTSGRWVRRAWKQERSRNLKPAIVSISRILSMVDPKITQRLPFFIWKPMVLGPQLSETPIFNQQGLEEMPSGSFRENHPLLKPGRSSTNGQFSMAGSQPAANLPGHQAQAILQGHGARNHSGCVLTHLVTDPGWNSERGPKAYGKTVVVW